MDISKDDQLLIELVKLSCQQANIDPLRLSVSITYLVDLVKAANKYLYNFDEVMIGAGKMKREGLEPHGLVPKIQDLQSELQMYATLSMVRLGLPTLNKESE